ncbi:MAG TPA: GGDEF domain-containing protein [Terracidiphilus sp.]|nr:GGDEF domain-containing protein [Terracidiphilus sp.]
MLADSTPIFLLASPEPALLAVIEPVLAASGARVEIVLSAQAALAAMTAPNPPTLTLLDVNLSDMEMGQLLAVVRAQVSSKRLPIVLISDTVTQEWIDRLAEGVIDDLVLRAAESPYWRLRLDMVMRTLHRTRELESLRETAVLNAQTDRLTGVYNRETLLAMLFRETDRVQRMKSSLCLILFDIDDFGHWNSRLGADACDDLLCQVVSRTTRLLRSYDMLGRPGMDEFLLALPGCTPANTVMLAERVRLEVFSSPFRVAGDSIRLSACFGIASSQGRSPVVVLRDAEQALQSAKAAGPESIHCFDDSQYSSAAPVTFLLPSSGDELLAW